MKMCYLSLVFRGVGPGKRINRLKKKKIRVNKFKIKSKKY
jgi:hypothetical protein